MRREEEDHDMAGGAEAWAQSVVCDSDGFEHGEPWKPPDSWRRRSQWIPAFFLTCLQGNAERIAIAAARFDGSGTTVAALPVGQITKYLQQLRGEALLGVGGGTTYKRGAPLRRNYVIPQVARLYISHGVQLRAALLSPQTTLLPSVAVQQKRRLKDVTNTRDVLSMELSAEKRARKEDEEKAERAWEEADRARGEEVRLLKEEALRAAEESERDRLKDQRAKEEEVARLEEQAAKNQRTCDKSLRLLGHEREKLQAAREAAAAANRRARERAEVSVRAELEKERRLRWEAEERADKAEKELKLSKKQVEAAKGQKSELTRLKKKRAKLNIEIFNLQRDLAKAGEQYQCLESSHELLENECEQQKRNSAQAGISLPAKDGRHGAWGNKFRVLFQTYVAKEVPPSVCKEIFSQTAVAILGSDYCRRHLKVPEDNFFRLLRGEVARMTQTVTALSVANADQIVEIQTDGSPLDGRQVR
jgi:hypothetical protein